MRGIENRKEKAHCVQSSAQTRKPSGKEIEGALRTATENFSELKQNSNRKVLSLVSLRELSRLPSLKERSRTSPQHKVGGGPTHKKNNTEIEEVKSALK